MGHANERLALWFQSYASYPPRGPLYSRLFVQYVRVTLVVDIQLEQLKWFAVPRGELTGSPYLIPRD